MTFLPAFDPSLFKAQRIKVFLKMLLFHRPFLLFNSFSDARMLTAERLNSVTITLSSQETIVGGDVKDILGKRPEDRTEEEIQHVMFTLRTYETFAEYPLNMQV